MRRRRRTVLLVLAASTAVILVAVAGYVAIGIDRVDAAITREPVRGLVYSPTPTRTTAATNTTAPPEPPAEEAVAQPAPHEFELDPNSAVPPPDAEFYLLLGSDSRAGHRFAATQGLTGRGRSDVMIIARVSPNSAPRLLSVPRDFRVRTQPSNRYAKINSANATGGLSAAVETVTSAFGIPLSHVVAIDFAGFEGLIDVVGGVEICPGTAERDRWTGLDVAAGCQTLDASMALAYARSRHTELLIDSVWKADGGGDFSRTRRQRELIGAIARSLDRAALARNLFGIAEALAGNVTVDDGLSTDRAMSVFARFGGSVDTMSGGVLSGQSRRVSGVYFVAPNGDSQTILDDFKLGR